jgi:hypothetical protein
MEKDIWQKLEVLALTDSAQLPRLLSLLEVSRANDVSTNSFLNLGTEATTNLVRALSPILSFRVASDLPLDFSMALSIFQSRNVQSDLSVAVVAMRVKNRIRSLLRDPDLASFFPSSLTTAFQNGDLEEAVQLMDVGLQTSSVSNPSMVRKATLLHCLLRIIAAHTHVQARQAWRSYAIKIAEYAYLSYNQILKTENPNIRGNVQNEQKQLLNIYWWLQVTKYRAEGNLPSWEGLRVVSII